MIYILDIPGTQHSGDMQAVVEEFTAESVELVPVEQSMSVSSIIDLISLLAIRVTRSDVVLVPWRIIKNESVDQIFGQLSEKCSVVVAAGNSSDSADDFSPASSPSLIVVSSLNKSRQPAKFSSRSVRSVWVPGTNIVIAGKVYNGTSVSAAIYSAFLANSIKDSSKSAEEQVNELIDSIALDK
jgi:hypothetical protein